MSDPQTPQRRTVFAHVGSDGKLAFPKAERAALDRFTGDLAPGAALTILIEEDGPQRSLQSLRYYFGAVVGAIADRTGYSTRETHDILGEQFLPQVKDRPWQASSLPDDQHTFSEYVEECIRYAMDVLDLAIERPRKRR